MSKKLIEIIREVNLAIANLGRDASERDIQNVARTLVKSLMQYKNMIKSETSLLKRKDEQHKNEEIKKFETYINELQSEIEAFSSEQREKEKEQNSTPRLYLAPQSLYNSDTNTKERFLGLPFQEQQKIREPAESIYQRKINKAKGRLGYQEGKIKKIEAKINRINNNLKNLKDELTEQEALIIQMEEELKKAKEDSPENEALINQKEEELEQAKKDLTENKASIEQEEEKLKQAQAELGENNENMQKTKEELAQLYKNDQREFWHNDETRQQVAKEKNKAYEEILERSEGDPQQCKKELRKLRNKNTHHIGAEPVVGVINNKLKAMKDEEDRKKREFGKEISNILEETKDDQISIERLEEMKEKVEEVPKNIRGAIEENINNAIQKIEKTIKENTIQGEEEFIPWDLFDEENCQLTDDVDNSQKNKREINKDIMLEGSAEARDKATEATNHAAAATAEASSPDPNKSLTNQS